MLEYNINAIVEKTLNIKLSKLVHGKPFKEGDLVWLFLPAVPRGHPKIYGQSASCCC